MFHHSGILKQRRFGKEEPIHQINRLITHFWTKAKLECICYAHAQQSMKFPELVTIPSVTQSE